MLFPSLSSVDIKVFYGVQVVYQSRWTCQKKIRGDVENFGTRLTSQKEVH